VIKANGKIRLQGMPLQLPRESYATRGSDIF